MTRAGRVNEEMALERMQYFVERVFPVCEEHKIRPACHLHDQDAAGRIPGHRATVGNFEGVKKFIASRTAPTTD
ncbi:MAG: hypothetical protein Ct9H300mP1_28050 [Planctomycetaceae bacterium]|nr:MAG: hypothetical protein Ct9H300mP1_28050 [Planctomycetaceae bacterium]